MTGIYRGIERREGLGFEGLTSPTGGEVDPPMWGTVLILVQYPTTLDFNVSGNFPPVKVTWQTTLDPHRGGGSRIFMAHGVANLYGADCKVQASFFIEPAQSFEKRPKHGGRDPCLGE